VNNIDSLLAILRNLDSRGPYSDLEHEALRRVNRDSGRLVAEDLLLAAERHAASKTAKGKEIAKLLPRFREFVEQVKHERYRKP